MDRESVWQLIRKLRPWNTGTAIIRLGPDGDGGYLVPDDLSGIEACFSPGVSNTSGFEEDCAARGMLLFMADKSVERPNIQLPEGKYQFTKKFIGHFNSDDYITMDEWVSSSLKNNNSDLLLQMDIESCEYLSFINMSQKLLQRFRIIVVEFHQLDRLWNRDFYKLAEATFDKILLTHTCVHIHPNNRYSLHRRKGIEIPVLAEFTFIRNDRITQKSPKTVFPDPLDFDNTTGKHIALPTCWYGE